jgi:thiamine kinase-like enzyme
MGEANEIKSWVKVILKNENLEDLTVDIVGNSENGDGYVGDIVFVDVAAVTKERTKKDYHLVLKRAKRSTALRKKFPVKESFLNEIHVYNTVFPSFLKFEQERGVEEPFDKVPKCYGTFITENMEVIALENLKMNGYTLWDRKKPLTRAHIDMVVKEYGQFHAISIAMKAQQPETFQKLLQNFEGTFVKILESAGIVSASESQVGEIYDLLKDDLDKSILSKWKNLQHTVRPFFEKFIQGLEGLQVIVHGDCWSNNFMYQQTNDVPSRVAMIDWQATSLTSPIIDLSYFLFATLSKEDMDDLDAILKSYHNSFTEHLKKLKVDPEGVYPFEVLLEDWKKYSKFGIIITSMIHKYSLSEKDEAPDMARAAEDGQDISDTFRIPIRDIAGFKKRMHYIVKYVADHDLI